MNSFARTGIALATLASTLSGAYPQSETVVGSYAMRRRSAEWRQDPTLPPHVALSDIRVVINGSVVAFRDQDARMLGNRVFVPLRGVFELLEATVQWNPEELLVTAAKGDRRILIFMGQEGAFINGRRVPLEHPAMLLNGRAMVPLRFISEALGASVDWRAREMTVLIRSG